MDIDLPASQPSSPPAEVEEASEAQIPVDVKQSFKQPEEQSAKLPKDHGHKDEDLPLLKKKLLEGMPLLPTICSHSNPCTTPSERFLILDRHQSLSCLPWFCYHFFDPV